MKKKSDYPTFLKRIIGCKIAHLNRISLLTACLLSLAFFGYSSEKSSLKALSPESTSNFQSQKTQTIHGTIKDVNGNVLPGVTILVKGTSIGTISDVDGKFSISNVPGKSTLIFSFIGMRTQEITVDNQSVIDLVLKEESVGLDEVIAIGYGTQTKKQVSASVANVTKEDFNKGVMNDAADLLKGKVAGLDITLPGGDVTQGSTLRLRGTTSLSASNDPLIVIDGVPGLSLNSIAPEDIESISVLKDASASAIYGSRGANGVIMITSRKGMTSKTQIEYNAYASVEMPAHLPRMLNATEYRDYVKKAGITNFEDNGGNTNWYDAISQTGISQEHNVTLSGGGEKHNYIATVNYQNREGVILGNQSERFNARFSFSQRAINDHLKVTITGVSTMKNWSPVDTYAFVLAKNVKPTEPIYNADGSFWEPYEYDYGNPVSMLKLNKNDHTSNYNLGNIILELDIIKGLKYSLNVSRISEKETTGEYINSTTRSGIAENGRATREALSNLSNILETNLTYTKEWTKQNLKLMAGYSYEDKVWDKFGAQNRDFLLNDFGYNNLQAGNNLKPTDVWSEKSMSKLISFYARAQYDLNNKYFLTATIRRDGSSKFGANHKWGYFPSASLAWLINEEGFMKDIKWINELKIRTGYGTSGNQGIDPYKSLATYGATGKFIDNGNIISGYQPNQNPNPDLRWETTSQFNVGIDYSFYNSRFSGSVEYYNKHTKDLLYSYPVPVPPYLYNKITANVGSMRNVGFEALLNIDVIKNHGFKWTTSINFATNRNEVLSLSNDQFKRDYVTLDSEFVRGLTATRHILEPGHPVGTFFGFKYKGINSNGKWIFEDLNNDGQITEGYGNDYTYIGNAFPKFTYGFSNSFTYKNFDVSIFFRGVHGNKILNLARITYENIQNVTQGNIYSHALDIPLNDAPKVSDYYVENGSYFRLENLTLGYTFNTKKVAWLNKFRCYFTGQNLLTFTKYTGTDPEVSLDSQTSETDADTKTPGLEGRGFYPKARTFTIGLNVAF